MYFVAEKGLFWCIWWNVALYQLRALGLDACSWQSAGWMHRWEEVWETVYFLKCIWKHVEDLTEWKKVFKLEFLFVYDHFSFVSKNSVLMLCKSVFTAELVWFSWVHGVRLFKEIISSFVPSLKNSVVCKTLCKMQYCEELEHVETCLCETQWTLKNRYPHHFGSLFLLRDFLQFYFCN